MGRSYAIREAFEKGNSEGTVAPNNVSMGVVQKYKIVLWSRCNLALVQLSPR